MSHDDDLVRSYERVEGHVLGHREKAALFANSSKPHGAWIARANVHPEDRGKIDGAFEGVTIALRIVDWKARESGFVAQRDTATKDLFGDQP